MLIHKGFSNGSKLNKPNSLSNFNLLKARVGM
jgi:hypothetical protein